MSKMTEMLDLLKKYKVEITDKSTPGIIDAAKKWMRENTDAFDEGSPKKNDMIALNFIFDHLSEPSKEYANLGPGAAPKDSPPSDKDPGTAPAATRVDILRSKQEQEGDYVIEEGGPPVNKVQSDALKAEEEKKKKKKKNSIDEEDLAAWAEKR